MTEPGLFQYGAMALIGTGWIGILAYAGLRAWNGWLSLKRAELELAASHRSGEGLGTFGTATRIDVADLKERIRKLEAIAAGIDL